MRSVFFIFVVSVFALTALMKFISLAVNPSAYNYSDPIFPFLQQNVTTLFAALLEIATATVILVRRSSRISEQCIPTLCGLFGLYRFGVWFLNYSKPCNRAGEIGAWLGIPDAVTAGVLTAFLLYGIAGNLYFLQKEKLNSTNDPS